MENYLEKEKTIIGTLLYYPDWMDDVKFKIHHFRGRIYRKIYEVMRTLRNEEKEITFDGVIMRLISTEPNIRTEISACLESRLTSHYNYDYYAVDFLNDAVKRQILTISENVKELEKEGKDVEFLLDYMQSESNKVANYIYDTGSSINGEDCLLKFYEDYQKVINDADDSPFINTGLNQLDKLFKFRAGLYILAGRPAMGKTAIGLVIAKNIAKRGKKVFIRSLEMSTNELIMRYCCACLTDYKDKEDLRLYRYKGNIFKSVIEKMGLSNMYINDKSATIDEIIADARQMKKDGKCDMLIIDYLSLIKTGKGERRDLEVNDITTKLKLLSKEINIPVLLLAQLNRAVEQRPEKKPILADLRESGGIEQDADVVIMVYRPSYYGLIDYTTLGGKYITADDLGVLIVRKNRHGRTGEAYLKFNNDLTDACDWDFAGEPKEPVTYGDDVEYEEDNNLPF